MWKKILMLISLLALSSLSFSFPLNCPTPEQLEGKMPGAGNKIDTSTPLGIMQFVGNPSDLPFGPFQFAEIREGQLSCIYDGKVRIVRLDSIPVAFTRYTPCCGSFWDITTFESICGFGGQPATNCKFNKSP